MFFKGLEGNFLKIWWKIDLGRFGGLSGSFWTMLAHVGAMLCILGSKVAAKMAIMAIKNAKMSQDGAQEAAKVS